MKPLAKLVTKTQLVAGSPPPRGKAARKWRRQMRNLKNMWKSIFDKPIEEMSVTEQLNLGA